MSEPAVAKFSVEVAPAREAFITQALRFIDAVEGLDDHALLSASRCHGWAVVDVVVHVRAGLEEMLRGVTSPINAPATVDAASYWSGWDKRQATDSVVDGILWTRRTASAYRRPTLAVQHLRDAGDAIIDAATRLDAPSLAFQGHVLTAGDFLATWAVELAVHHVDIGLELDVALPAPSALALTRATVTALMGKVVPDSVSDLDTLLIGAGRSTDSDGHNGVRGVLG